MKHNCEIQKLSKFIAGVLAAVSFAASAAGFDAVSAKAFFNDNGCNACHAVDEPRIGPPYKVVATRYAGESPDERTESLAMKIRHGGAGAWGIVPMPSHPRITRDDSRAIARWILSLHDTTPE